MKTVPAGRGPFNPNVYTSGAEGQSDRKWLAHITEQAGSRARACPWDFSSPLWVKIIFSVAVPNGRIGCFCPLGIVNNALMNMMYKYPFKDVLSVLWGYIPRNGIVGSQGNSIFNFLRKKNCLFIKHILLFPKPSWTSLLSSSKYLWGHIQHHKLPLFLLDPRIIFKLLGTSTYATAVSTTRANF